MGWSGQIPGQYVLGPRNGGVVHEGEHGYAFHDEHGNVDESEMSTDWDPTASIEGAYDKQQRPKLMQAASSRPITRMSTHVPTHTLQTTGETEHLYDAVHGDQKRRDLDADVAEHGVSSPIPMIHHQGRLVVLDGHHRLLAARKSGQRDVPVQIFDHDQHVARGNESMMGSQSDDPYDLGSLNDLLSSGQDWTF